MKCQDTFKSKCRLVQLRLALFITKTYLYNFEPLKPHFYIVKLGFTGVYIIFLISAQKHRFWVLVRTASVFKNDLRKISEFFLSENVHFLAVKFSVYLNRHVFVMKGKVVSYYQHYAKIHQIFVQNDLKYFGSKISTNKTNK